MADYYNKEAFFNYGGINYFKISYAVEYDNIPEELPFPVRVDAYFPHGKVV